MVKGGIGAPRTALENLKVDVKAIDYVEIIAHAVTAYNSMYDLGYKPQDVLEWNLDVDLLVQGSPCTDFSQAGKGDINQGRSILYTRTLEIIEKVLIPRPKYVVWENVTGLLTKRHIEHFNHYLESMEKLGYKNYYKVIKGTDVGIPHNRPRVFVVSVRNDIEKQITFKYVENVELKPMLDYLDPNVVGYEVNQPSMLKALEQKKVKIICDNVGTITTKQVRWNNAGIVVKNLDFYKKKHNRANCTIQEFRELYPEYKEDFRYLTELECWRLLGFTDKQFNSVKSVIKSSGDLYRLAGNSIIVDVLEKIFKEILE